MPHAPETEKHFNLYYILWEDKEANPLSEKTVENIRDRLIAILKSKDYT